MSSSSELSAELPDIVLVGAGLRGASQLTLEAVETLRQARLVFWSPYNTGIDSFVTRINPTAEVRDLESDAYEPGLYRPSMYASMAAEVTAACADGPGVVVLQPGSAVVVDTVTQAVLAEASTRRLSVAVIPGISAVDAVLSRVGFDLAEGLQVVLAQQLVLRDRVLDPSMAAIIMQPGYYDTRFWFGAARSAPGRFDSLVNQLQRTWEPATPMALVLAPVDADHQGLSFWFRLRELDRLRTILSPFHTIFVPPAVRRPVVRARLDEVDDVSLAERAFEHTEGQPIVAEPREWFAPDPRLLDAELLEEHVALSQRWSTQPQ